MALSSLNKLQLIRALLLLVILLDVVGPAVLLLHLGSGENLKETLVDQVSLGPEVAGTINTAGHSTTTTRQDLLGKGMNSKKWP